MQICVILQCHYPKGKGLGLALVASVVLP